MIADGTVGSKNFVLTINTSLKYTIFGNCILPELTDIKTTNAHTCITINYIIQVTRKAVACGAYNTYIVRILYCIVHR